MALASRSPRRSGAGSRWLVIGVVITLFVLLVSASLKSRSPGPGEQLAAGAWIDRILPIITASTEEGQQLATIWATGLQTPAANLMSQVNEVSAGAAKAYQQAVALRPPVTLAGAAGLLEACLLVRKKAAASLSGALRPVLVDVAGTTSPPAGPTSGEVTGIVTAGADLQISDQAYQLFIQSLPKLGVTLPGSVWATNPAPYQANAIGAFLTSLQNARSSTPVHEVKIYAVTTSPAAVSGQGSVDVLPDASTMSVTVVVADVGNQPEKGLTVTAAIAPGGNSSSVRDFVDLVPGQAITVVGMGPLTPPQGVTVTLTVTATPAAGSSTPAVTQTLEFMMPSAAVTSTTTPATSTTTTSTSSTG